MDPPTPTPIAPVADAGRDFWDWLTIAGTAASCLVGLVAVLIAAYAIYEAKKARQSVADERQRVFEMETLRSLAGVVDTVEMITDLMHNRHLFIAQSQARLALLPPRDLPNWRRLLAGEDLLAILARTPEERDALQANLERKYGDPGQVRLRAREVLLADLQMALEARTAKRST